MLFILSNNNHRGDPDLGYFTRVSKTWDYPIFDNETNPDSPCGYYCLEQKAFINLFTALKYRITQINTEYSYNKITSSFPSIGH